jgi:hypothetical protein
MELHYSELEVHLVVFEDLEGVKLIKVLENPLHIIGYVSADFLGGLHINGIALENLPEINHTSGQGFN